jgi:acyl dehydratase
MPTSTTLTMDEIAGAVGTELGSSDWFEITQDRVNLFADATEDHQWIHVDPERAASGPFGGAIAHGYLTLSLLVPLFSQIMHVPDRKMGVNYGLNKLRFPSPVKVGSKIRLTATLAGAERIADDVMQVVVDQVIEIEGGGKPAMVAQAVYRYYR